MSRSSLILLGFVSINLLVPTLRGDEPPKTQSLPTVIYKRSDLTTPKALHMPIDVSTVEMPLRDVLEYISDYMHVQIYTDPAAFDDVGIDPDFPVTMELKQVPVKQALDLILTKLGLTYIAKENFILITDEDELVTRVYPIVDILHAKGNESVAWLVKSYRDLIIETVSPDSWATNGGQGTIAFSPVNTSFVITASAKQHARIEALLEDLRLAGTATQDWLESEGDEAEEWQQTFIELLSLAAQADLAKAQEAAATRVSPSPGMGSMGGGMGGMGGGMMGGGMGGSYAIAPAADNRARQEVAKLQAEVEKLKAEIKRLETKGSENRR